MAMMGHFLPNFNPNDMAKITNNIGLAGQIPYTHSPTVTKTNKLYIIVEESYVYNDSTYDHYSEQANKIGFSRDRDAVIKRCAELNEERIAQLGNEVIWYLDSSVRSLIDNNLNNLQKSDYPVFYSVEEIDDIQQNNIFYTDKHYTKK